MTPSMSMSQFANSAEFKAWKEARNAAFRTLDVVYCRNAYPSMAAAPEEVLLMALHKGRYECTEIEAPLRHESRAWLAERGLKRIGGMDLLPEGELPE